MSNNIDDKHDGEIPTNNLNAADTRQIPSNQLIVEKAIETQASELVNIDTSEEAANNANATDSSEPPAKQLNSEEVDEREAYHDLVHYAPICIHEIGLDGCLMSMNQAGLDMMGLKSQSQIIGLPYTSFVGDENQSWITDLMYKAIHGQAIANFDFSTVIADETRSFSSNFIPMFNPRGKVVKIMGVSRETTEEVQAKDALLQLNLHLKDRINAAIKELQDSVDTLSETQSQLVESKKMAALGSLVSGVAHEINTPLGVCITASSLLETLTESLQLKFDDDSLSHNNLKRYLDESEHCSRLISFNLSRAADLVQNFKQIAVDQSGEYLRSYNLKRYIQGILNTLLPKLKDTSFEINLCCVDELEIYGDPSVLTQILTNLVMNSLCHGFENATSGMINITVLRMGNSVQLIYRDSGCGISSENLDKIYEPFFTTKRASGSSGLGLNMVYNLVTQALAGSIVCHSELNKGTQFTIEFPCELHR
ncbi:MAG: PAS domain-containing sensor histidine kinase [Pseudomonadales bacterium]|nr:PAS domain-containing sensor histidine kinase [Pseudomonadales bacterium]NRA14093.1 PAS domain-containing sensor histidine kinase [Oceanospirillaceae bacterium]